MIEDKLEKFLKWIEGEEAKKGWTDYRLAKEAKISTSVLSKARNEGLMPKWDACVAIANALDVSPITAFRMASLLPPGPDEEVSLEDWGHLLAQMTPGERDDLMRIGLMTVERRQKDQSLKSLKPKKA
jgi:hypothetical protein